MITIRTEKETIYINDKLIKAEAKKIFIFVLRMFITALCLYGIATILNGIGKLEFHKVTFEAGAFEAVKGFVICIISFVLYFIKNALQYIK